MYRIYKTGDNTDPKLIEYIADTESDVQDLPTDTSSGSTCIVIQGSGSGASVYMLGNDKIWHEI